MRHACLSCLVTAPVFAACCRQLTHSLATRRVLISSHWLFPRIRFCRCLPTGISRSLIQWHRTRALTRRALMCSRTASQLHAIRFQERTVALPRCTTLRRSRAAVRRAPYQRIEGGLLGCPTPPFTFHRWAGRCLTARSREVRLRRTPPFQAQWHSQWHSRRRNGSPRRRRKGRIGMPGLLRCGRCHCRPVWGVA